MVPCYRRFQAPNSGNDSSAPVTRLRRCEPGDTEDVTSRPSRGVFSRTTTVQWWRSGRRLKLRSPADEEPKLYRFELCEFTQPPAQSGRLEMPAAAPTFQR